MTDMWTPEIEKKYKLDGAETAEILASKALRAGFVLGGWMLQKDWVPDFDGFLLREQKTLLRIRNDSYLEGVGPAWTVTLKRKAVVDGVHHNQEFEASAEQPELLDAMQSYIAELVGKTVNLKRLALLDMDYARSVGLTEHRMYIEKRRRAYSNDTIPAALVIDELPLPAGWFAEVELKKEGDFSSIESQLGLDGFKVIDQDYGDIVKEITKNQPESQQRYLGFETA